MKQNIFLMFVLLLAVTGCGSKSDSPVASSVSELTQVEEYPSESTLEQLQAAVNRQIVACGEPGLTCPSFSAKLAFWGKSDNNQDYFIGVCSGSLYKGKYIITNSHCIPREMARAGASCESQLKVLFPTTKYNVEESAKCRRVIQVYNTKSDQPDIAVIELNREVERESVEIATDSFVEGGNVTAYTMNPSESDSKLGTITKKTCTLSTDNAYFMSTNTSSAARALISGTSCDVIHGNSGTGLLNKNGKLIGAVFARMEVPELARMLAKYNIYFNSKVPMGLVQNISCLNDVLSSSGFNCKSEEPSISDFNEFIERSKVEQKVSGVNESQLEYELTTNFKLKLKEVSTPAAGRDLNAFRETWIKVFFGSSDSSKITKVLRKFVK